MGKIKRMMAACISLVFSAAAMLSFSACKKPPEPKEKIDFRWSMSALTTAIERSYAKATGRKSEAVLDAAVLNDIIASVDYEEIRNQLPFYRSYLYSIEIESISEFYVDGSHEDAISEYCGSGPYRVLIADYMETIHQRYISHSSDYGFRERYFSYQGRGGTYIAVEGANGQLLFSGHNSRSHVDSVEIVKFTLFNYAVGLESKKIIPYPEMQEDRTGNEYPRSQIELTYNGDLSFTCVFNDGTALNGNGYRHEYEVRQESLKTYELHDEHLVTDLVVPIWYNHGDYAEHPAG